MNYAEALAAAARTMNAADLTSSFAAGREYTLLAEGWIKLAAEIRKGMTLTSEQADRQVDGLPVQE